MKEYVRINVVGANEVDRFIQKGWEIVETSKEAYPEGDTFTKYHVGLPAKHLMNELLQIVKAYEKHDLKSKLYEAIANQSGEKVGDYEASSYSAGTELSNFMETYENVVNGRFVKYAKANDQDEFKF